MENSTRILHCVIIIILQSSSWSDLARVSFYSVWPMHTVKRLGYADSVLLPEGYFSYELNSLSHVFNEIMTPFTWSHVTTRVFILLVCYFIATTIYVFRIDTVLPDCRRSYWHTNYWISIIITCRCQLCDKMFLHLNKQNIYRLIFKMACAGGREV
jgi:hypothetical protein